MSIGCEGRKYFPYHHLVTQTNVSEKTKKGRLSASHFFYAVNGFSNSIIPGLELTNRTSIRSQAGA